MGLVVPLKSATTHVYLGTSAKGFSGPPPRQARACPLSPPSPEMKTHGLVPHERGSSFTGCLQLRTQLRENGGRSGARLCVGARRTPLAPVAWKSKSETPCEVKGVAESLWQTLFAANPGLNLHEAISSLGLLKDQLGFPGEMFTSSVNGTRGLSFACVEVGRRGCWRDVYQDSLHVPGWTRGLSRGGPEPVQC